MMLVYRIQKCVKSDVTVYYVLHDLHQCAVKIPTPKSRHPLIGTPTSSSRTPSLKRSRAESNSCCSSSFSSVVLARRVSWAINSLLRFVLPVGYFRYVWGTADLIMFNASVWHDSERICIFFVSVLMVLFDLLRKWNAVRAVSTSSRINLPCSLETVKSASASVQNGLSGFRSRKK